MNHLIRRLELSDVPQPRPETLTGPTLAVGQTADLKRESYVDAGGAVWLVRWWLKRCGVEDGDTGAAVEVEARLCPNGSWFDVGEYGSFDGA